MIILRSRSNSIPKNSENIEIFIYPKDITKLEIERLNNNKWLNDRIMNYFITVLMSKEFSNCSKKYFPDPLAIEKYFIFNTFFCLNILALEKSYYVPFSNEDEIIVIESENIFENKQRQILLRLNYLIEKKYMDLRKFNTLFIPFLKQNHWSLVVVKNFDCFFKEVFSNFLKTFRNKKNGPKSILTKNKLEICHLDSFNSHSNFTALEFKMVADLLNLILIGFINFDLPNNKLDLNYDIICPENTLFYSVFVPFQKNSFDCGTCVLENIEQAILSNLRFINPENPNKKNFYSIQICTWKREMMLVLIKMQCEHQGLTVFLIEIP